MSNEDDDSRRKETVPFETVASSESVDAEQTIINQKDDEHKDSIDNSSLRVQNAPNKCLFRLTLSSNLCFVMAAALYFWMAVISVEFSMTYDIPVFHSGTSSGSQSNSSVSTIDNTYDVLLLYWYQLPPDAKAAAQTLGYDQETWDTGVVPAEIDVWWDVLSVEQKEAAKVLGYDKTKWNGATKEMASDDLEASKYEVYKSPSDPYMDTDYLYTMLYIVASVGFVTVGLLHWIIVRKLYPGLYVVGGLFGFISAVYDYISINVVVSAIFSAVSIHCFFLMSIALIWHRVKEERHCHVFLWVAEVAFWIGSVIEVVLSYVYIFDTWAEFRIEVSILNAVAQSLWVVCGLLYTIYTLKSWPDEFIEANMNSKSKGKHCFN
eukprot:96471_1